MDKIKLLILFGGMSPEHEVSCASAASVVKNAPRDVFSLHTVGITRAGRWLLTAAGPEEIEDGSWEARPDNTEVSLSPSRGPQRGFAHPGGFLLPDCVFPVLHGENGEDGRLQGLLTLAGIPFVGSGAASSAICMDKAFTKMVCSCAGIPQADWLTFSSREPDGAPEAAENRFSYPMFVKPANTGSSVGVSKAKDRESLRAALALAAKYDEKILVEEFIDGYELEVAVLGNHSPVASRAGRIIPSREFYSYESKYQDNSSELIFDPELPDGVSDTLRSLALKIYRLLDCRGLARVDFFMRKSDGAVIFNEINTIPGFTKISMYPKLFEHSGLPYPELISRLVSLALEDGDSRRLTQ